MSLLEISDDLARAMEPLRFAPPVAFVYNPLIYAREAHRRYLETWGDGVRRRDGLEALFLGMNPGPWGMAQTGVPFGTVSLVRDWMGIEEPVAKPPAEHPKRPVEGFACTREEVSGQRLWGWARDTLGEAETFFRRFFVGNYCPLQFLNERGSNLTPDKLPAAEQQALQQACDLALRRTVQHLRPARLIGVGAFAEKRARLALEGLDISVHRILHPSPASPAANRGWAEQATQQLQAIGVDLP